jgi:signal transduction histidine kinase
VSQDANCNWKTKPAFLDPGALRQRLQSLTEEDAGFREYLSMLSRTGLQTLGFVEIAAAVLLALPHAAGPGARLRQMAATVGIGVLTLAISRLRWSRAYPRLLAAISAWAAPAALVWCSLWKPSVLHSAEDYVLAAITLIVLGAVAAVPLRPWQAFAAGISVVAVYILCIRIAALRAQPVPAGLGEAHSVFLLIVTALATAVAAANYRRRSAEYAAQADAVRSAEALAGAQLRAQLAENAISIGKMAAALSHEINSPLGTLRSSIETLVALTDRQADAPPELRQGLEKTRAELCRSIGESAARIDEVTARLRRLASLEDAETKPADLNELLTDVALIHEQALHERGIRLDFDLEHLPPFDCRPQLLSAAFSALLSNAIDAVRGGGRIEISTRRRGPQVEITIRDNGRGMSPEEADGIFDPSLKIEGGRVASGNWSLFNSRQIVYEHGGEIRLNTAEGAGTSMSVILPAPSDS